MPLYTLFTQFAELPVQIVNKMGLKPYKPMTIQCKLLYAIRKYGGTVMKVTVLQLNVAVPASGVAGCLT
jgi:hypothetical protein